jgi:hypothetical protein
MKMIKIALIVCAFAAVIFPVSAQEKLTGLMEHPLIMKMLSEESAPLEKMTRNEAVKMPFIDDFSSYYGYPRPDLWADSLVFISDGYGINNITNGCVTFDAFNASGKIYEGASSFPFKADNLTSLPVRLDSIFTGTPHIATPADSIYLSFFYQPQGLGDKPEPEDSLVLQLFHPGTNSWNTVWSSPGMSLQQFRNMYGVDFKSVMIPVTDPGYFSPDFRFRFYNYASLANNAFSTWIGNVDFWIIDYVYLNAGRNKNDTFPVDVAFRQRQASLLNDYHSMPWSHFLTNPSGNMVTSVALPYTNYSSSLLNLTERLIITDLSGTTSGYNSGISASNLDPLTDTTFVKTPFPYTFQSNVTENAEFLAQFCINTATIPDMVRSNDTVSLYQRFYNYFSYDDGSPEAGYALVGSNAQLAYKFSLSHPDTLRTIQMQFNRVFNDINENLYFHLRVWNESGGKPGDLIYDEQGIRPVVQGFYGFHDYVLKEPLPVNGNIYVGWKQQDSEAMNIGFDKNTNRNTKIFYNIDGQWMGSMYEGALMIRIIVGSDSTAYVSTPEYADDYHWNIVPNPVYGGETFSIRGLPEGRYQMNIFATDGKLIRQLEYNGESVRADFPAGIYVVSITHLQNKYSGFRKLIISK